MKVKLLYRFVLYVLSSRTIKGKISFNNYSIANAEIVNTKSKHHHSDGNGLFKSMQNQMKLSFYCQRL
jgi:hypothetical protein